jgi:hypothetical protein
MQAPPQFGALQILGVEPDDSPREHVQDCVAEIATSPEAGYSDG